MHVRTPEKRAAFTELLSGGVTALHMDARVDGLRVPSHLRSRAWLVLNFSYGYQLADFNFDDDGVVASLSFGGRPFPCFVPWEAVFAMSDDSRDTFHLWREDMRQKPSIRSPKMRLLRRRQLPRGHAPPLLRRERSPHHRKSRRPRRANMTPSYQRP